ncbi:small nuclear ribonucleoprotein Sm D3 [Arachnomyces sp. PD_36]|nr:small nuclear ribonucleoprotein Sm D3 [Arachnomyces sp. PD_36]
MGKLTSTIGIPIKLLNEAQGHVVTLEITSGQVYRGKLLEAEDNMNVQLKDITVTARDGRVSHLDQVYIRGSHVSWRGVVLFANLRGLRVETHQCSDQGASEDGVLAWLGVGRLLIGRGVNGEVEKGDEQFENDGQWGGHSCGIIGTHA